MNRDKPEYNINSSRLISLFRGIYGRVARELGVDPSYVSRVARGQRKSEIVQSALENEMKRILEKASEDGKKPFPVTLSQAKSKMFDGNYAKQWDGHAVDGHPGNGVDVAHARDGARGSDGARTGGISDGDGAYREDGAKISSLREIVPIRKQQKRKSPQGKPRKA